MFLKFAHLTWALLVFLLVLTSSVVLFLELSGFYCFISASLTVWFNFCLFPHLLFVPASLTVVFCFTTLFLLPPLSASAFIYYLLLLLLCIYSLYCLLLFPSLSSFVVPLLLPLLLPLSSSVSTFYSSPLHSWISPPPLHIPLKFSKQRLHEVLQSRLNLMLPVDVAKHIKALVMAA